MTLDNLIIFYLDRPKEAERYLQECLHIRRKLAKENPSAQDLELARTLMVGGFVYEALNEEQKSQDYFKEGLSIAEKYADVPFAQQLVGMTKEKIKNSAILLRKSKKSNIPMVIAQLSKIIVKCIKYSSPCLLP